MRRDDLAAINAFVAVAQRRSFTAASAHLGVSPSAVSHAVRDLERHLGVQLLTRSTRSVGLTEAGDQYLARVMPALDALAAADETLNAFREAPRGLLRLNLSRPAYFSVLSKQLPRFRTAYPDIRLELVIEDTLSDIVASDCDAGVRLGEALEQDMIAIPVSDRLRMRMAASPTYFAQRPPPKTPGDLADHICLGFRYPGSGAIYRWELERDGRAISFAPNADITCNDSLTMIDVALGGAGLCYCINDLVDEHIASGRLIEALPEWAPEFPGYFLYHSSRRDPPAKLRALIDTLRFSGSPYAN